jgi:hypothetical protein
MRETGLLRDLLAWGVSIDVGKISFNEVFMG